MCCGFFFFFKQKTAYELRISDWSSDVCSSDLTPLLLKLQRDPNGLLCAIAFETIHGGPNSIFSALGDILRYRERIAAWPRIIKRYAVIPMQIGRSEEHTSELQSLMRISYAVFCLKKKQHEQYAITIMKKKIMKSTYTKPTSP